MAVVEIPARKGKAAPVHKGRTVKVVNTRGQQVVDTWAFNADDLREFLSMEHSRVAIGGIIPKIGSILAGSNFPHFDINPNSGEAEGSARHRGSLAAGSSSTDRARRT